MGEESEFDFRVEDGIIWIKNPGREWERPPLMGCLMEIYMRTKDYRHLKPSMLLDILGVDDPRAHRYDDDEVLQNARDGKYDEAE